MAGNDKTKSSAPLKIIPLGGLDGIGKNMTAFQDEILRSAQDHPLGRP